MSIISYGPLSTAVYAGQQVQQKLNTLTEQVSDGLVSTSYAGLGAGAQTSFDLSPQISTLQAEQNAIDLATGHMGVQQTALSQISSVAGNIQAQIAQLASDTPTEIDDVAVQAQGALQEVASLLDTQDGGDYVFAGTDVGNPPVPDPGSILTSGFFTQISSAVAALDSNGASATEAATLSIASSNATGTTPFTATSGKPATLLVNGASVTVGLLAGSNTIVPASSGTGTTGSYIRDILRGLATIASLSSAQAGTPALTTLLSDTDSQLGSALGVLNVEQGALGNTQSQLQAESTEAASSVTALQAQVSSVQDVDMASAITQLTQVQTQLSASYKAISEVSELSLVNYL